MKNFLILFVIYFALFSCSKKDEKKGTISEEPFWEENTNYKSITGYVKFPNVVYGIDFCNLKMYDIILELNKQKMLYRCDGKKNCNGSKKELSQTELIQSNYFIGTGLEQQFIISVNYDYYQSYGSFHIVIKMNSEYYNSVFESLTKQYGYKNASLDVLRYDEISWYANPTHEVKTCVDKITISKRLRYDNPYTAEKQVFYLTIETRGRDKHVH